MNPVRVRFAPSPTGPLHIGGLRTALYNYLFARKHGGTFILRVEDTDQNRYVEGAEEYIRNSLQWAGIAPDEGPQTGGEYGPYRQSERKALYQQEIQKLIDNGTAYLAFDTPDEISAMRSAQEAAGIHSPKYDYSTRMTMRNSLTLAKAEVEELLASAVAYTVRLKVDPDQEIKFQDKIRGEVIFNSSELDDKVLMKSDGLPTYHLANVIDDHSMKISHVIRGEEWLSSTAHHVLLYHAFGWQDAMPVFAHLPLILKPSGKGKLSKRDGQKLGIPVFPLNWESEEGLYPGFRELGFLPEAVINFLAFLGWNPGGENEIYSLADLANIFSLEDVSKGGARFDFDKATWFNQQYLLEADSSLLVEAIKNQLTAKAMTRDDAFLQSYVELFRPRIQSLNELYTVGNYFFETPSGYNEKMIRKKWKDNGIVTFRGIVERFEGAKDWQADALKSIVESGIEDFQSSYGEVLPLLRIALTGDTKGPDLFETLELMGRSTATGRLKEAPAYFDACIQNI